VHAIDLQIMGRVYLSVRKDECLCSEYKFL